MALLSHIRKQHFHKLVLRTTKCCFMDNTPKVFAKWKNVNINHLDLFHRCPHVKHIHSSNFRAVSSCSAYSQPRNVTDHARNIFKKQFIKYKAAGLPGLIVQCYATEVKAKVRGIQKDIWPLTTKRIVRRKKTKDSTARDKEVFDAVAYATAEELDLEGVQNHIAEQGLYEVVKLPHDAFDCLHVEAKYRIDNEAREIFFFREGSVVFWNMPEVERNAVLRALQHFQEMPYDSQLIQQEFETIEFTYTETPSALVGDEIQLRKPHSTQVEEELPTNHHHLEKFAFSNALGLSVKLGIWEASLQRYVESIEYVLQDLKEGRKVRISRSEVLRKTGELYTLRHLINLSSDLLDIPDFYWDREDLESLYSRTCNHLNVQRRTKVMNEKLTYCCDLADLLTSHLNDKHHVRLEWMIILLIMVEVVFEIVHMMERKSDSHHQDMGKS